MLPLPKQTFYLVLFGLLFYAPVSGFAQEIRKKNAPVQAPTPKSPEARQPELAVTGVRNRASSYKLALLADVCAFITAGEVEEIMSVSNSTYARAISS